MSMYDLPSRTAFVPNAAEPLNCIQTSSDAWGDVENSGELFGKAQSATPRNQDQPIITVAFAEVKGESWQDE
jgi:hypothetical protein